MEIPRPHSPTLSVVVGSNNARTTIASCLETLVRQCDAAGSQLIVVDNSEDGTDVLIRERFPQVRLIRSLERKYIPELWAIGMEQAEGAVVAITTAHCIPAEDWVAQILQAHASDPAAGIGGAIESDDAAETTDWAIYFCRYYRFMQPLLPASVHDIAGDNASYKRWALERYRAAWEEGFWEPDVHREILNDGGELRLAPQIVVRHKRSFSASGFLHNRFQHGRQFGQSKASRMGTGHRIAEALKSPLVPAVLLSRVVRTVLAKRRHLKPLARALPLIALFYTTWAAGEATGYLTRSQP
ncbi:MAG TPA: glycosyltransferase [Rhodothermales bacterium]|nr:glycosyltransferase [Rhodothermales bacterium]